MKRIRRIPFVFLALLSLSTFPRGTRANLYINAGSDSTFTDSMGNTWEADQYFTSGTSYRTKPAVPIDGTGDDELYLSGRFNQPFDPPMRYDIPLDEGNYKIIMHFVDTYGPTQQPGLRVFDVALEGETVLKGVDIAKEAGPNTALQKTVTTSVTDGVLSIEFIAKVQNPAVSGIEVHPFEDPSPIFLNCGGPSFRDSHDNEWLRDTYFSNGRAYRKNDSIGGTEKQKLYQSQRFERKNEPELSYEIPLDDGIYDVYFHFAETYWKVDGANQRVFDVLAEGSVVFEKLDVYSETGSTFKALVKKRTISVIDGSLSISFRRRIQNPMISGIEVHAAVQQSPEPYPLFEPIRINAGGRNYTDKQGNLWIADRETTYFNTGLTFGKLANISGTDDDTLFQSERWDVFNGPPLTYEVPVPNGVYDVRLYFTEIFSKAQAPKKRVFDVFVEDELIYEDLDIFKEVGGYAALVKETIAIVTDGVLTIRFKHKIRDPKICAIEILLAPPSSAPSMAPSLSFSPTAPTFSPAPSDMPSMSPTMFPTETLLPWINLDEDQDYVARHECSFVQAGDKFYLFGGREMPKRLDIYDYKNDEWTQGTPAPLPFNHFQAVVHEGLIWVIGAFETNSFPDEVPTKNVYVYDPAADVWMIGPPIRWPRGAGGLVVYNDRFYLLGGNTAGHDGGFVPWFDTYNPKTGEWKLLRDAPHARDHFHAVVLDDKLYAVGGRRTIRGNTLGDTVKECDVYDLVNEEWLGEDSLPRDLPEPRASAATVTFDGKIIFMGGETRDNPDAYDRVDALDPSTGRWTTLTPMNNKRHGFQAIQSGDGIFVAAGSPRRGGGQQRKMEVYNSNSPEGTKSEGGVLGMKSTAAMSVTIQHTRGNQGVFVNSIELDGPSASEFAIKNSVRSRFLIPKGGTFQIDLEFTGIPNQGAKSADVVVTYTGSKVLRITLIATR